MKIVVDLNRCRSYGQCVFLAPKVFRFHGEQSLEYDYNPDDELRVQVERAAAACPVQAISIGRQAVSWIRRVMTNSVNGRMLIVLY
jgi:ferredoxin